MVNIGDEELSMEPHRGPLKAKASVQPATRQFCVDSRESSANASMAALLSGSDNADLGKLSTMALVKQREEAYDIDRLYWLGDAKIITKIVSICSSNFSFEKQEELMASNSCYYKREMPWYYYF